jgi:hypothetical protein
VTSSRSAGTVYTNTKSVPIFISIVCNLQNTSASLQVNGIAVSVYTVFSFLGNGTPCGFANPGDTYELIFGPGGNPSYSIANWYERY